MGFVWFVLLVAILFLVFWFLAYSARKNKEFIKKVPGKGTLIRTPIAGFSHSNDDGTSRQRILKSCNINDEVTLKHEPVPQDSNAVKVFTSDGLQMGFLSRNMASKVAPELDKGKSATGHVSAKFIVPKDYGNGEFINCRIDFMLPE